MNDSNTDENIEENMDFFGGDDFVFTKDKQGNIVGGGYKIDSFFLREDVPIMTTINDETQNGGKVSSPFENLAVPAGLFYVNMRVPKKHVETHFGEYNNHETISDDMIDKLYSLIEADKKIKRKTKKYHKTNNKKTHKNNKKL